MKLVLSLRKPKLKTWDIFHFLERKKSDVRIKKNLDIENIIV